jgi:uncharacterized protein YndB with AHSA1/START domain
VSENTIVIGVPPEDVFAVLADPHRYADWVVGAQNVRGADGNWPSPGARLHHSTGAAGVTIDDETEVVEVEPPSHIVLLAHLGPLGTFRVDLRLEEVGDGLTHVTMEEHPVEGISTATGPVGDAAGALRNRMSLARLKSLAER